MFWHEYFKQGRQVHISIIPGRQTAASHLQKEVKSNLTETATNRLAAGIQISLDEQKSLCSLDLHIPHSSLHVCGTLKVALCYFGNEVELHVQDGPLYPHDCINHPLDNTGK